MVLDTTLSVIEFGINTGFMVISFVILYAFISRFEGNVQYTRPNILGFILMALGLSFHILGNLTAQLLAGSVFYESGFVHFVQAFISLAILMFIMGTSLILYHIVSEDNKSKVKVFGYFFLIVGIVDTLYHFLFFFTPPNFEIFGQEPVIIEAIYLLLEMILLTFIYVVLFLQARRSPSKVVAVRYQLIAVTAIGFVLVILTDMLIKLQVYSEVLAFGNTYTFVWFLILHVLTVGALYLLVLFPQWYKDFIGIS